MFLIKKVNSFVLKQNRIKLKKKDYKSRFKF